MTSQPLRLLLIEDTPDDEALVLRELRSAGYEPECRRVETEEAMRGALADAEWDLIISDNALPRFSARSALALLRASARDIPLIVVSGSIGEEFAVELMKLGAHDYLFKGNLRRLGAAVERELREAASRRERREAEVERLRSAQRLDLFMKAADVVLYDYEFSSSRTWWSDNLSDLLGLEQGVGRELPEPFVHYIHPDEAAEIRRSIGESIESGARLWTGEFRVRRADDSYANVLSRAHIVRNAAGAAERLVGALLDITERRQLEAQFYQSQKMEAVGRLAGGIAHDFNNILTVITSLSDVVLQEHRLEPACEADIRQIRTAAERASALTRQLLTLSRKQVLQPQLVDVGSALRDMQAMLHRLIGEDIAFSQQIGEGVGRIKVDPGQLQQVLLNLAVNARDAMPRGGRLRLGASNVELDQEYALGHQSVLPGSYVLLTVADTGDGMNAATQARIFEPFFTTKEAGKGTGLGLSTVYGIVKQSGGHIWVYSEPGKGTTFKVYFPRSDEQTEKVARHRRAAPAPGTETIVVAEDDEAVRRIQRRVLERSGYTVLDASNGNEALQLIRQHSSSLHLLVTDVVMPGMGGGQLALEVASLRPELRILFTSGYPDDDLLWAGVRSAEHFYLEKPFTPDGLLHKVREVLDS